MSPIPLYILECVLIARGAQAPGWQHQESGLVVHLQWQKMGEKETEQLGDLQTGEDPSIQSPSCHSPFLLSPRE